VGVILINASCMLVSPQTWFALPPWLRLQGSRARNLHEDRWSALQLRVLGAVIIATVGGLRSNCCALRASNDRLLIWFT
jgi:hypothetical protein